MKRRAIILGMGLTMLMGADAGAALIGFNAEDGSSASGAVTTALGSGFDPAQSHAGALGGAYITTESAGGSTSPGSDARTAGYSINFTEAGTYDLYARVYVNGNGSQDSMFYGSTFGSRSATTDADWITCNGLFEALGGGAYVWVNLSDNTGNYGESGVPFAVATPGIQTFMIGGREIGLWIDALAFGTATETFTDDQLDAAVTLPPALVLARSPAAHATVLTNAFPLNLATVLLDGSATVDTDSIALRLDGTNLVLNPGDVVRTAATTTVSHAVASLEGGIHTVSLVYTCLSPASGPHTNSWSFTVTAPPPICPRWAFEPWVWEDNANTQASTTNLVADYKSRGIPVGAVIVDSPWSTAYQSFEWDTARFPDAAGMISDLRADDVRVVLWTTGAQNNTGVDTPVNKSPYFDYVINNGYAVNDGAVYSWWKGTGVHIDFTNPDACDWFGNLLGSMMDLGVDGWKVDQAEASNYLPYPVSTSIGSLTKEQFKPYYYGAVRDKAFEHNPESLIIARPFSHQDGYAASIDKCTIGWGGDYNGSFSGLKGQITDLYTSAETGYGALAVEIGGYQSSLPTKETLIRYTQFGALMPVMENGGSNGGLAQHLPWYWDAEAVDIYRYYATLHSELAPYLFSCSVDAHLHGGSIVKSVDFANEQHQLGDQLFAALITGSWTSRNVTLPSQGAWIDYWNEDQIYASGTGLAGVPAPLDTLPIYIRAGAIIPMNVRTNVTGHGDVSSQGRDTIVVYPFGISSYAYHRPRDGGIGYDDISIVMDEEAGQLTVAGATNTACRFRIKSFSAPSSVTGADAWSYDAANGYIIADKSGSSFSLEITGLDGYAGKATSFGLWQDLYDIAGAAFDGDADLNGVIDGAEYYLGSNPTNPLSPQAILTWSPDHLSATYLYNPLAAGVTGTVEWAEDLLSGSWSDAGVTYTTNTQPDEIEASVATGITNRLFLRLRIGH